MASNRGGAIRRLGLAALVVVAVVFAVEGGEFGTLDLVRQKRAQARIGRSIDSLKRLVDSLRRYQNAVEHDPATQERIARERFGMIRRGEFLYKIVPADSAGEP